MNSKQLLPIVIVALFIGGLAFFGGMQYQKSRTPAFGRGQFANLQGRNGGAGGQRGANGQAVRGQIASVSDGTLTVKMPDGSSKIVLFSGSTAINKATTGSASDLTSGENVLIFGATNSDGSVTAQNISLGDFGGRFGQGGNVQPGQTQQGREQPAAGRTTQGQGGNAVYYQPGN